MFLTPQCAGHAGSREHSSEWAAELESEYSTHTPGTQVGAVQGSCAQTRVFEQDP